MESSEIDEIAKMLESKQMITRSDIEQILDIHNEEKIDSNISCNYMLIKNGDNFIRYDDLLKLLFQNIVFYILRYEEYQTLVGMNLPELVRKGTELVRLAVSKFQQGYLKSGETGELILFVLLESQGITQLLNKMRLKTNPQNPIYGTDALHIQFKSGKIFFHYGEAKMHESFTSALTSTIDSVQNFDHKQEELELDLVSSYIDRSKFEDYAEKIVKLANPYEVKENLNKAHSIFIGYNWKMLHLTYKTNLLIYY